MPPSEVASEAPSQSPRSAAGGVEGPSRRRRGVEETRARGSLGCGKGGGGGKGLYGSPSPYGQGPPRGGYGEQPGGPHRRAYAPPPSSMHYGGSEQARYGSSPP